MIKPRILLQIAAMLATAPLLEPLLGWCFGVGFASGCVALFGFQVAASYRRGLKG